MLVLNKTKTFANIATNTLHRYAKSLGVNMYQIRLKVQYVPYHKGHIASQNERKKKNIKE